MADSLSNKNQNRTKSVCRLISLVLLIILNMVVGRPAASQQSRPDDSEEILKIKQQFVELINSDRHKAGLPAVQLDKFASQIADRHCQEMLADDYLSHWNRAGLKPYMRYSLVGGVDAVAENVSSLKGAVYADPLYLFRALSEIEENMINERPPNDGHRRNILDPQHTHVGIGIAFNRSGLRVAQEFIAHYVEMDPVARNARAGKDITIKGRLLNREYAIAGISLFYEPLPKTLTIDMLNSMGSYSLPDDEVILRPLLGADQLYTDGSQGEIEYNRLSGKFSCHIGFPAKRAGIYTIVLWLKSTNIKFPATNITIEVA